MQAIEIRRFASLAAVVLAGCAQTGQVDVAAEEQAIREAGQQLVAREAARDAEGALAFYTDDAVAQLANQPAVVGKEQMRAAYQQFFDMGLTDMTSSTTTVLVAESGDLAAEWGVNNITFTMPSGPMTDVGKYLAVWRKVDGAWKIAAISVSSDAPPPPMDMIAPPATTTRQ